MPTAPVTKILPQVYPQSGTATQYMIPLGAPLVMNSNVAFPNGMLVRPDAQNGAAPFLLPPNQQQIIRGGAGPRPKKIFLKLCRNCGLKRGDHMVGTFGLNKCTSQICGRCGLHVGYHRQIGSATGVDCEVVSGPLVPQAKLTSYDAFVSTL